MTLSHREKEVLSLLAQGLSNAAIGSELFISPATVKVHVRHIFEKLGVKSRAAAALRAHAIESRLSHVNDRNRRVTHLGVPQREVEVCTVCQAVRLVRSR